MKYGYIKDDILPEHYIFGDAQINALPIQPDGQWDDYLPQDEYQNKGFETYACASFGTLHAVQTLMRRLMQDTDNYSDRFLASISGTAQQHGNSPHAVAEYLRKVGAPMEYTWPFLPSINSFEVFYAPIPQPVVNEAQLFVKHFDFQHDWVPTDKASLKSALRYSPLGISVYAWEAGIDGIYRKPAGASDNHWCVLYGYEDGVAWYVFDSYDNTHKKLSWDFTFEQCKRYSVKLRPETQAELSTLTKILNYLLTLIGMKSNTNLITFCTAIRDYEGSPGNLNYQNNNPGNCRCSSVGYAPIYGNVLCVATKSGNFAKFPTYALGWLYLQNLVKGKVKSNPNWTIKDFFHVYAPSSDSNNPDAYAAFVAKRLGVPPTTVVSTLF